jgi:uncharacterized protein YbjT (DUF2867 family)
MRVLVIGGTGFIGQQLVGRLVAQGDSVFVPTRRLPSARELLVYPTVTVLPGDVYDEAVLDGLMNGMDAVINLVGILHGSAPKAGQPYGPEFERAHVELPGLIAKACVRSGVQRFVHVSALGASAQGTSAYSRSKAAGEAAIMAVAKENPLLCVTILQPSVVFGPKDKFMNMFAGLARFFPVLPLAGSKAKMQPIYVVDLAQAIANCLVNKHTCGQTYEMAGPNVYTLGELVALAAKYSGRPRPVIDLPMSIGRMQAWFFECLPGEPLMSRDNLDSLKTDNVATKPIDPVFGVIPTPLEAIVPSYLRKT